MDQVAVILTDHRRRILWVNDYFEVMTGYDRAAAFGQVPGKLLQGPETDPAAVQRIREALAREQPFEDALINYRKNGEAYVCQLAVHPIHDPTNRLTNFLAFETDGGTKVDNFRSADHPTRRRYESSSLKGFEELQLFGRVVTAMEREKLYLNSHLSLRSFAAHLNTNIKYLSQVINRHGRTNFLGFVNNYRIEEFRRRLLAGDSRHTTLFGIAERCGFKNKSTFFKVFREKKGMTPKAFQEVVMREEKRKKER